MSHDNIDTYWGETYALCQQVSNESKPAACIAVRYEFLAELIELVENFGLRFCVKSCVQSGKVLLWIFKFFHMTHVVDQVSDLIENGITGTVQHWMLFKALGFSEQYIEEYFMKLAEEE